MTRGCCRGSWCDEHSWEKGQAQGNSYSGGERMVYVLACGCVRHSPHPLISPHYSAMSRGSGYQGGWGEIDPHSSAKSGFQNVGWWCGQCLFLSDLNPVGRSAGVGVFLAESPIPTLYDSFSGLLTLLQQEHFTTSNGSTSCPLEHRSPSPLL